MELTKNQWVLKALLEDMTRRAFKNEPGYAQDVVIAMKVLQAILPPGVVFVMSGSTRLTNDFANAIERKCHHIGFPDALKGLGKDTHFVQLHTGARSVEQLRLHKEIMQEMLISCPNATIWHIGEWRA